LGGVLEWSRSHQESGRWDVVELEQRFSLAWNKTVTESAGGKLIFTLNPRLTAIEEDLNLSDGS
jgi:hypothetical protein